MMKILFVCNSLISGGAEKLLSQLLPLIKNQGHEPCLLLLDGEKDRYSEDIKRHDIPIVIMPPNKKSFLAKICFIKKFIKEGHYDIIHANLFPSFYYVALVKVFSKKKKFPKLFLTEHNVSNKRRNKIFFRPIEKFIYKAYDKKISISQSVYKSLIDWLKETKRINTHVVIDNGIDISTISSSTPLVKKDVFPFLKDSDKILCLVGSFTQQKNHIFMIDVLYNLPSNYYLMLLGEGPLEDKIKNHVNQLGLNNRVMFMGYQSNPYQYMKMADAVVMPSLYEGFGLVAVEALASEKPLVYADLPALKEIVGEAGLCSPLLVDEYVKNIIKATTETNNDMIIKALEIAKKYDINIMSKRYVEEFLKLVSNYDG